MKIFTSNSQKIGELGEDIACNYLIKHGYSILERNYTKKWGEIDIIAKKNEKLYFVEVKSKSITSLNFVSYETSDKNLTDNSTGRPEENMHPWKLKRLAKTVQTYLIHKRIGNTPWQFDLLVVYMDIESRKARVKVLENIIL